MAIACVLLWEQVRAEHCDVPDGFGASRVELTAGNYGVTFTPDSEYRFVADPGFAEPMGCGLEWETQRPPIPGGLRQPLDIHQLSDPEFAVQRIRGCFKAMGWTEAAVTVPSYTALQLAPVELIALRLYTGAAWRCRCCCCCCPLASSSTACLSAAVLTRRRAGPCFILYNGVLRAMASGGVVRFGFPPDLVGASVRGRFTTTLHAINSGVIKCSRLQPKCAVYRGMNGLRLPRSFVQPDVFGLRSGVECVCLRHRCC